MDIKLNLSYYASIMLDAFKDLAIYYAQIHAGIIGLGLDQTSLFTRHVLRHVTMIHGKITKTEVIVSSQAL